MDEYQVWCLSWDQRCSDSLTLKAYNPKRAAEKFAEIACNNKWAHTWPIKIAVQLDVNKKSRRSRKVKIFNVVMINNPSFVATGANMKNRKEQFSV